MECIDLRLEQGTKSKLSEAWRNTKDKPLAWAENIRHLSGVRNGYDMA